MAFFLVWDVVLLELAIWFSFLLRFDGKIPSEFSISFIQYLLLVPFMVVPILYLRKIYWMNWTYVSISDLINLVKGLGYAFLAIGGVILISRETNPLFVLPFLSVFPRSVVFITFFLAILFLGSIRISKRVWLQMNKSNGKIGEGVPVAIIGRGDKAEAILRSILASKDNRYVVGFIEGDRGTTIHGFSVLGPVEELESLREEHGIKEAIIAYPDGNQALVRKAVEACRKAGIERVKIAPSFNELLSDRITLADIRDIEIEDLLGRNPATLDFKLLESFLKDKVILVTGAAGSVGRELARQIAKFDPRALMVVDQSETGMFWLERELKEVFPQLNLVPYIADVKNRKKVSRIFEMQKPQIVFHAAAYKHVPLMEDHPEEAIFNNIFATRVVAEEAIRWGVEKFVLISTDKAVNPISIMGTTKRWAEILISFKDANSKTDLIAVRFGNVLGSSGSVVEVFREQIKKGGPVTVTHPDMERYFLAPSEAVLLVLQASAIGKGGKIYLLDMGKPVRIVDLAREMIRLSGYEPDVDIPIVFTEPRPGDKFAEAIYWEGEEIEKTPHPKIFELDPRRIQEIDEKTFFAYLERLFELSDRGEREELITLLRSLS